MTPFVIYPLLFALTTAVSFNGISSGNHHGRDGPNPSDYSITVLGMVRHIEQIKPSSLKAFDAWCLEFGTANFYILTNDHVQSEFQHTCNVTLVEDNPNYGRNQNDRFHQHKLRIPGGARAPTRSARVQRIATVRDQLRSVVRSAQAHETTDAIVVIDLDLLGLPSVSSLTDGVSRIVNNEADVVCANGVEKFMGMFNIAYDLFAMELFPWPWVQRRLYNEATAAGSELYQPSEFCFGGMAVYNPQEYLNEQCSYSGSDEECEHVTLHKCMKSKRSDFGIGVLGTMRTEREFDTTLSLIILAILFILFPFVVFRR